MCAYSTIITHVKHITRDNVLWISLAPETGLEPVTS